MADVEMLDIQGKFYLLLKLEYRNRFYIYRCHSRVTISYFVIVHHHPFFTVSKLYSKTVAQIPKFIDMHTTQLLLANQPHQIEEKGKKSRKANLLPRHVSPSHSYSRTVLIE